MLDRRERCYRAMQRLLEARGWFAMVGRNRIDDVAEESMMPAATMVDGGERVQDGEATDYDIEADFTVTVWVSAPSDEVETRLNECRAQVRLAMAAWQETAEAAEGILNGVAWTGNGAPERLEDASDKGVMDITFNLKRSESELSPY